MKIAKVMSSGLDGAEKAALDAAKKANILVCGWRPKDAVVQFDELIESHSTAREQSTIWNVRDSHATLVLPPVEGYLHPSLAVEVAESYGRPVLVSDDLNEIVRWLNTLGDELTLNVMGASEEQIEGSERASFKLLSKLLVSI